MLVVGQNEKKNKLNWCNNVTVCFSSYIHWYQQNKTLTRFIIKNIVQNSFQTLPKPFFHQQG